MQKPLLLGLLVTLVAFAQGQTKLPPVYEIKADTSSVVRLPDAYWQMLEDPEGKWSIDDVTQPPLREKFHANTTEAGAILDVDYSVKTFWVRYRFKNSTMSELGITLPRNVTQADLFTLGADQKMHHKTTGTLVPWSKRNDLKRITAITYNVKPGEEVLIYERDYFDYWVNAPDFLTVNFGFTNKAIQDYFGENDASVLPSFLFGFFLLAALFNLYFFRIVRKRVYLFFSLTLFFRGFSRFLFSADVFFREHPTVKWELANACSVFFFFFLIHFVRRFLKHPTIFPAGINASQA